MKEIVRLLGTAAREGIHVEFCQCDTCREAKKRGGKDHRTGSSLMIGNRCVTIFY